MSTGLGAAFLQVLLVIAVGMGYWVGRGLSSCSGNLSKGVFGQNTLENDNPYLRTCESPSLLVSLVNYVIVYVSPVKSLSYANARERERETFTFRELPIE